MILCLCFGLSDRKVKKLLESGEARTVREIQQVTQCGQDCGSCMTELRSLVEMAETRRLEAEATLPGLLQPA